MTLIVSLKTNEETQDTDPLLALAGTLNLDVKDIKKHTKDSVQMSV